MPPRTGETLDWQTLSDFTAGLYQRGDDRECPPNGLLECLDCYPLAAGGVRSGPAWQNVSVTNLPTTMAIVGFIATRDGSTGFHSDLDQRSAGANAWCMMLAPTMALGGANTSYERWSSTGESTAALSWSSGATHLQSRVLNPVSFVSQYTTATTAGGSAGRDWYFNLAASSVGGVYRIPNKLLTSTGAPNLRYSVPTEGVSALVAYQDRLVSGVMPTGGRLFDRLSFSFPADSYITNSGTLIVDPANPGDIMYLDAAYPSDLFVHKVGQGFYSVQGDLASPLVRQVLTNRGGGSAFCWGARLPEGIIFLTENDGAWMWTGGGDATHISPQLAGSPMTRKMLNASSVIWPSFLGQLAFIGNYVLFPLGYVWDKSMRCWWQTSVPSVATVDYPFWCTDISSSPYQVIGAGTPAAGGTVRIVRATFNESTMIRSTTFSMTLPIIDLGQRQVEIRAIEIFGQSFGTGGTWTVTLVNPAGTAAAAPATATFTSAGICSARFDCGTNADWIKIRVQSAGNLTSEAPMIHRIGVATQPRQQRPRA